MVWALNKQGVWQLADALIFGHSSVGLDGGFANRDLLKRLDDLHKLEIKGQVFPR